jgi:hypothetical protein
MALTSAHKNTFPITALPRHLLVTAARALEYTERVNLGRAMNVTVQIPDDLGKRLAAGGVDLSRRALEAFAAEEYKRERLTKPELQRLLGIETSFQLDEFLKAHDVWIEYTREDAERERLGLERLGY